MWLMTLINIILVSSLWGNSPQPLPIINAQPDLVFRTSGTSARIYVDEEIRIQASGSVIFRTLSPYPFDADSQNSIGTFAIQLPASIYSRADELMTVMLKKRREISTIAPGVILNEYIRGREFVSWEVGSKSHQRIEHFFGNIRRAAQRQPLSALTLTCRKEAGSLNCFYRNIGKMPVDTIDPLGVTHSIACLGPDGSREYINRGGANDPRKMQPKKISIGPGQSYTFKVKIKSKQCRSRVLVQTAAMRLNPNFSRQLLGISVSNRVR